MSTGEYLVLKQEYHNLTKVLDRRGAALEYLLHWLGSSYAKLPAQNPPEPNAGPKEFKTRCERVRKLLEYPYGRSQLPGLRDLLKEVHRENATYPWFRQQAIDLLTFLTTDPAITILDNNQGIDKDDKRLVVGYDGVRDHIDQIVSDSNRMSLFPWESAVEVLGARWKARLKHARHPYVDNTDRILNFGSIRDMMRLQEFSLFSQSQGCDEWVADTDATEPLHYYANNSHNEMVKRTDYASLYRLYVDFREDYTAPMASIRYRVEGDVGLYIKVDVQPRLHTASADPESELLWEPLDDPGVRTISLKIEKIEPEHWPEYREQLRPELAADKKLVIYNPHSPEKWSDSKETSGCLSVQSVAMTSLGPLRSNVATIELYR